MLTAYSILADEEVRQGLKVWVSGRRNVMLIRLTSLQSDWPTFPQLYLKGELVGGLDILREELEADPDFLSEYQAAPKGRGGMSAPEAQSNPSAA